jgi:hypothetical protein
MCTVLHCTALYCTIPMPRREEDEEGGSVVQKHWEGRQSGRRERISRWSKLLGSTHTGQGQGHG